MGFNIPFTIKESIDKTVGSCKRNAELESAVLKFSQGKENIILRRNQELSKYQMDSVLGKYAEWFVYAAYPWIKEQPDMRHYPNGNDDWADLQFFNGETISVKSCRPGGQISWVFQADIDPLKDDWFVGVVCCMNSSLVMAQLLVKKPFLEIASNLQPLRNRNLTGKKAYYYVGNDLRRIAHT